MNGIDRTNDLVYTFHYRGENFNPQIKDQNLTGSKWILTLPQHKGKSIIKEASASFSLKGWTFPTFPTLTG